MDGCSKGWRPNLPCDMPRRGQQGQFNARKTDARPGFREEKGRGRNHLRYFFFATDADEDQAEELNALRGKLKRDPAS